MDKRERKTTKETPHKIKNGHLLLMSENKNAIMVSAEKKEKGGIPFAYISIFSFLNGKCKCGILREVCTGEHAVAG